MDGIRDPVFGAPIQETVNDLLANVGRSHFATVHVRAATATQKVLFRVGTRYLHVEIVVSTGLASVIAFKEGVKVTEDGTALTTYNRRRGMGDLMAAGSRLFTGATYTDGVTIRPDQSGFVSTPGTARTSESAAERYELQPGVDYALEVTPDASTDIIIKISCWEE